MAAPAPANAAPGVVTGRVHPGPGDHVFPRVFTGPGEVERPEELTQQGLRTTKDVVVMTCDGWRTVEDRFRHLSVDRIAFLEPAYIPHITHFYTSMISGDWPERVRRLVQAAVLSMDPRLTPANQRIYRRGVANKDGEGRGGFPTAVAVMALRTSFRGVTNGITMLARRLERSGTEFLLDFSRVQFNDEGTHVKDRQT
ncbi:hypothetical protein V8F20_010628 [Naviculisporaceae sp. PSN 640]